MFEPTAFDDHSSFIKLKDNIVLPFNALTLSHKKMKKSIVGPLYLDDSFDEIIGLGEKIEKGSTVDVESYSILEPFDEVLYDLIDNKNEESDDLLLMENNLINSPFYKRYSQLCFVSPYISKVLQYSNKRISNGEEDIKKFIKIGKRVNGLYNDEIYNKMPSYINNAFKDLYYLNQRCIILKVIDNKGSSILNGMNDKYITAYNAFHLPVTFKGIKVMSGHKDGIINAYMTHVFDNQVYFLRHSRYNYFRIHEIERSTKLLRNEVLILSGCSHPNIIRYFSSWVEYQCLYEQLEYAPGGSLEQYIQNNLKRPNRIVNILSSDGGTRKISCKTGTELIKQISLAVAYLQLSNLVHGSISMMNVMIFPRIGGTIDMDTNWVEEGFCDPARDFPLVFKLMGFERCCKRLNLEFCQDTRDTAIVVVRSMLGILRGAVDDMWHRVYPISSWCSDNVLSTLLEVMLDGKLKYATDVQKFISDKSQF